MPTPAPTEATLSEEQFERILERITGAVTAVAAPGPAPERAPEARGDHPLKAPLQRSIRKLQADIRQRSEAALKRSMPAIPPTGSSPAGWHILTTGATRASAPLADILDRFDQAALEGCTLPAPVTLRFAYRWVRAQYATDDHGELTATAVDRVDAACLLEALDQARILGRHDYGKRPWALEARFTPSQEASP